VGVALLELVFALWVIAQGAAPWMHAMLLALWLPLTVGLTWHYGRRLRRWTEHRLLLTHEQEAQTLCEAMGLGELLKRMHGGLSRRIGETGWQLSHGERSRLFLARALLQGAPLTVMDESFAALDPQTLARCLSCAMANTDTWLVIAHP
jgi:ABC-type multidrug transport system fused ATPase/permease subunit